MKVRQDATQTDLYWVSNPEDIRIASAAGDYWLKWGRPTARA